MEGSLFSFRFSDKTISLPQEKSCIKNTVYVRHKLKKVIHSKCILQRLGGFLSRSPGHTQTHTNVSEEKEEVGKWLTVRFNNRRWQLCE